jgi:hypothetical protein
VLGGCLHRDEATVALERCRDRMHSQAIAPLGSRLVTAWDHERARAPTLLLRNETGGVSRLARSAARYRVGRAAVAVARVPTSAVYVWTEKFRSRVVGVGEASEKPMRTRWLAKAEAEHGGNDAAAESGACEPGAGAAPRRQSRLRTATWTTEPGRARTVIGRVARDTALRRSLRSLRPSPGDRTRPPPAHSPPHPA